MWAAARPWCTGRCFCTRDCRTSALGGALFAVNYAGNAVVSLAAAAGAASHASPFRPSADVKTLVGGNTARMGVKLLVI